MNTIYHQLSQQESKLFNQLCQKQLSSTQVKKVFDLIDLIIKLQKS